MSETDLFGNPAPKTPPRRRRATNKRGHAAQTGTGPAGETCGTCEHLARRRFSKTYLKCGLMHAHWTSGAGTDIRARDAACSRWEARVEQ